MPPQIPPPLPTDEAAPQPPEPVAHSEHKSKYAATKSTSFPLKGFTNLATPCADNQLEVTRVKKSTLSAEAQTSDDQPEQKRRKAVHTRKRPAANAGVDDNQQDLPGQSKKQITTSSDSVKAPEETQRAIVKARPRDWVITAFCDKWSQRVRGTDREHCICICMSSLAVLSLPI